MLLLTATPAFADGQGKIFWPWWLMAVFYICSALVLIGIAFIFSMFYRLLYEHTRKEKRRTIIWMVIFTLAFPSLFAGLNSAAQLIHVSKYSYSGMIGEIFFRIIFGLLTFAGFNVGYFITPKREMVQLSKKTRREKRIAIFLQIIFCVIVPAIVLYLSISPELKRLERMHSKKERRLSAAMRSCTPTMMDSVSSGYCCQF